MSDAPETRDYFAEMYVAGCFADAKWNVYFPRRDTGFDFIVTKDTASGVLLRPVQVKGLYPTSAKTPKAVYGYLGRLSQLHPAMVLAITFFPRGVEGMSPVHIAFMPRSGIRASSKGRWRSVPARYDEAGPKPRRDFEQFFDAEGLRRLASPEWL